MFQFESKLRKPTANPPLTEPTPTQAAEEPLEKTAVANQTPSFNDHPRSNSTQPTHGSTLGSFRSRKRCDCQSRHDIELRVADEAVQRCHRMLREIIKLQGDMYGKFYLAEMLNKV